MTVSIVGAALLAFIRPRASAEAVRTSGFPSFKAFRASSTALELFSIRPSTLTAAALDSGTFSATPICRMDHAFSVPVCPDEEEADKQPKNKSAEIAVFD